MEENGKFHTEGKKTLERSSARFHQQKGLFLFELTRKDFFYFTKTKQR